MEVAALFFMIVAMLLIGTPIAVALGLSSITFLLVLSDTSLASIAQTFFQAMAGHYTLLAIPFFILASSFMSTGGVAKRIIRFQSQLSGIFREDSRSRAFLLVCCSRRFLDLRLQRWWRSAQL